ncbi:MAG: 16S rRNA (cytidine(1402)-2'-O)-methyltransferase [Candidatus Moranbacteria bacterium]|nr:16S rRNA (cytidine(1402)-2'-O)-methyltransferase [Candidatus Moranbacteria bacterium]
MDTGILYIVATPIGNLEDITFRAVRVLGSVDLVVCEDTRVTRRLLDHYGIKTQAVSFYRNLKKGGAVKPVPKLDFLISEMEAGKNLALVTDAGTPGISDPGNQLVAAAVAERIPVIPVPGVSAVTTLASVSGIDLGEFVFLGFPPHKKGRETFFKKVVEFSLPVIYYESPHRVLKNLELLQKLESEKRIILGRELTKMFEEIVRGSVSEVMGYFQQNPGKVKGEFVIIVY